MSAAVTEAYVNEVLSAQGVAVAPQAAKAIAAVLSHQLATAAGTYAALPFEVDPATFLAVLAAERA